MLSDELLNRIVTGSGRVYNHEAKDMATELLAHRKAVKDAQAKAATGPQCYAPGAHSSRCRCATTGNAVFPP